ncbi:hypothetical protein SAMN04488518_104146 [Pseudovibrio ascidiaceicola]|uniref:Uncharacterized protein n=1 Tax=Pseudovibrio ascidiaceicola TaxID=285279 RepID=A0A1I3YQR5_9HYPH|nr:hypothetical protein SAMN04488518_104146 [Pseudovibrio ascidiaceicola]
MPQLGSFFKLHLVDFLRSNYIGRDERAKRFAYPVVLEGRHIPRLTI